MTSQVQSGKRPAGKTSRAGSTWAPWAVLGLLVAILLLLASVGPARLLAMITRRTPPLASGPLKLTIVHSNDTWGYVSPCG